jgi:16S rRNA (guanine1207-N2)-methyltransferase
MIHTHFSGQTFKFITASGVFSKRRIDLGTRLLVESTPPINKGFLLDIGCGYGVIGITLATLNPNIDVIMTDINERAIWLTKRNVKLNDVKNVEVRQGNLYEAVNDLTFKYILSNPPISSGIETVKIIIQEAFKYLEKNGFLYVVLKSKISKKRMQNIFEQSFGNVNVLAKKSGYRVLLSKKT